KIICMSCRSNRKAWCRSGESNFAQFPIFKFWTGRVPDEDIDLYLRRFCDILHTVKPVDKLGIWYGVRKYKVRLHKNANGHFIQIPNSISLGPYNGRIIYPGQSNTCFICQSTDHQVKDCTQVKCWRCGHLGHKAKDCSSEGRCSLCGVDGHTFFTCPDSYANKTRSQQNPKIGYLLNSDI
uniref:CCHC-type domain-containing protein n=1 Tax=Sphaeramia orbicularis TaxID=375764 RepID=A0A672Y5M5_9TELE